MSEPPEERRLVELSFVIPVFNGANSIERVVSAIQQLYSDLDFEIVLINDGSRDASEQVCLKLQQLSPTTLTFVNLARNFGEHNAVLAGLNHAQGRYVAVLDDDGQNPPEEVRPLYEEIRRGECDAVYGRYRVKQHGLLRNLGSWFNDRVANFMLHKPPELYLSSFKILNRFLVDEITRYQGGFPYIDGLILRATDKLGQIEVDHRQRGEGAAPSNYTPRMLFRLWLNMFLNFSIMPLRVAAIVGALTSSISFAMLVAVVIDKLYINPDVPVGVPTLLMTVALFSGVQLLILGTIGEYLGRLFLDQTGAPQFVVRYVRSGKRADG